MSSDRNFAVEADCLSKVYHLYQTPSDRFKQMLLGRWRTYFRRFEALRNVSLQLPVGEVLGVVGRNGAGKSTLLQLLCGTLTPSSGSLRIHGRIAALLELGAGFNPLFSGRENIYLSASILGLSKAEIDQRVEEIIDFSGVRPFIDQPVSTYSSGMFVRLAFSVATSVDPDILVIDEALSVGDGDFARRSFDRIMAMKERGKTIIFCSHSLYQVEMISTRAVWLEQGEVMASGAPADVIPQYQAFLDRHSGIEPAQESMAPDVSEAAEENSNSVQEVESEVASSQKEARLVAVNAHTGNGSAQRQLDITSCETSLYLDIEFHSKLPPGKVRVAAAIHGDGGQLVTSCGNWAQQIDPQQNERGQGYIRLHFPQLPLLKGRYRVGVLLFCDRGVFLYDEVDPVVELQVTQPHQERGLVMLPHRWSVDRNSERRWQAVDGDSVSETELRSLFAQVFGAGVSRELWRWKYRWADVPGSAVLEADRCVAFYGGLPRRGRVMGVDTPLVQIGDVMVAAGARGSFSRKGPFYLAAEHYIRRHIGPRRDYPFAFGFPHKRAAALGVKLGFYRQIDCIKEVCWSESDGTQCDLSFTLVNNDNIDAWHQALTGLWQQMAADCEELALGARDVEWLRYRYLEKPGADYLILALGGVSNPLGLLVLRRHAELGLEWLDGIAPRKNWPLLVSVARGQQQAGERLFVWMTPRAVAWIEDSLAATGGCVNDTDIIIPGDQLNDPEYADRLQGRWWLMGGDADFR